MAGYPPGVTGVVVNAAPIDEGTLARIPSPSSGTLGIASKQNLSEADLEFIRTTAGKRGSRMSLQELQHSREFHIQQREDAERRDGPGSYRVLFEQATVDYLGELIEEAQSPIGMAAEQVRKLIEEVKRSGSEEAEKKLSQAMGVLVSLERKGQLEGTSNDSSEVMALMADALNAAADRRSAVLKNIIEKVKGGSPVTDEQLSAAVADVFSVERQRELLGASETDSGPGAMALAVDALNAAADRKKAVLEKLVEEVKRAATCTPEMQKQLHAAATALTGSERQRQLLGVSQTESERADIMALVKEAESLR